MKNGNRESLSGTMQRETVFLWHRVRLNFRNERALLASFAVQVVGMILSNSSFFIIWIAFSHTVGVINGWSAIHTFGMLSISIFIFGLTHTILGTAWTWPEMVPTGAFDTLLTKPKNLYIQTVSHRFSVAAAGDLLQGAIGIALFLYLSKAGLASMVLLLVMLVPAAIVHIAFIVTAMSVVFWIPQAPSLGSSLGNLLLLPSTQPVSLLDGVLRWVYLFAFPALVVAGLPIEMLIEAKTGTVILSYAIAFGWLYVSCRVFYTSVRRYESGNAIGGGV